MHQQHLAQMKISNNSEKIGIHILNPIVIARTISRARSVWHLLNMFVSCKLVYNICLTLVVLIGQLFQMTPTQNGNKLFRSITKVEKIISVNDKNKMSISKNIFCVSITTNKSFSFNCRILNHPQIIM